MKLFEKVDPKIVKPGVPPLVFTPPATGYIPLTTPEALQQWEAEIKTRLGVDLNGSIHSMTTSCSGGCADDCDMEQR